MENLIGQHYQHYKSGKTYKIVGLAHHSETLEEVVIYQALYHCATFGDQALWVRPKAMFFEFILYNDQLVPRFKEIRQE